MVIKIQAFKRQNGSIIHTATIPKDVIDETGHTKGTRFEVSSDRNKRIILTPVE